MLNHFQVECPEGIRIYLDGERFWTEVDWREDVGRYVGQTAISFLPCRGSSAKLRADVLSACSCILVENGYTVTPPKEATQ